MIAFCACFARQVKLHLLGRSHRAKASIIGSPGSTSPARRSTGPAFANAAWIANYFR
jgi:hypothetical protein